MSANSKGADKLGYELPNGMKVRYDAKDQSIYLASVLRSLYAHDRLVRQVITGLAGRDVRRALEIFLDFCKSGHIGEDEIFEIRRHHGNYELSLDVVTRVLLRVNHKFYSGERSYLKNLVQCVPDDAFIDHFVRISILRWFDANKKIRGPAGVEGFHRVQDAVSSLSAHGHDARRVTEEIAYLVRESCLLAEHLRLDKVEVSDLVKISSSGVVHLQLLANPEYIAACAEDTYIDDEEIYSQIASIIASDSHYSKESSARIVEKILIYLRDQESKNFLPNSKFIDDPEHDYLQRRIIEIEAARESVYTTISKDIYISNIAYQVDSQTLESYFERLGLIDFQVTLPKSKHSNVNRGYGFLKVSSDVDLRKIILHTDLPPLQGRAIQLKFEERKEAEHNKNNRSNALSRTVYLGNIPPDCTEQQIRTLLAESDVTAKGIKIIRKQDKNYAFSFLDFKSIDDASAAIGTLDGKRYYSQILRAAPAKTSS